MPHPTTDIEEILKEFDKEFPVIRQKLVGLRRPLLDFISSALTSYASTREARLREEIGNLEDKIDKNGGRTMYELGYKDACKNVLALFTKETSNE